MQFYQSRRNVAIFPGKSNESCSRVLNILIEVSTKDILANHTIKSFNSLVLRSRKSEREFQHIPSLGIYVLSMCSSDERRTIYRLVICSSKDKISSKTMPRLQ